jgi:hypothetical protein
MQISLMSARQSPPSASGGTKVGSNHLVSSVVVAVWLGLQVTATSQVLAQGSPQQPQGAPPIIRLDPGGCREIPPFVHCDVVTPGGPMTIEIPKDQAAPLVKQLSH